MRITYTELHAEVMKERWETGETFYYVEGIGSVSEEEATEIIRKKRFEELHQRHREYLRRFK